jgi:hypothetical protein
MTVKAKVGEMCSITEQEMSTAIYYKIKCDNAIRSGNPLPAAPQDLAESSQSMLQYLAAGRKVIPGTVEHSKDARISLYASRRFSGSHQVFFTISPDDLKLESVYHYCGLNANEISHLTSTQLQETAANNPVAAARHFHDMVDIIIKHFFCFDVANQRPFPGRQGPFGVVLGFCGGVEEQHRGSLHLHCLLYIKGLPSTASEMLRVWKCATGSAAIKKYMEMVQSQTSFLPTSELLCPACSEADVTQPTFTDNVTKMTAPHPAMMEPTLIECPQCIARFKPTDMVSNWVQSVLSCDDETARSGFVHDDIPIVLSSNPVKVDGAGPSDGLPYSLPTLAKLASRTLKFNSHSPGHTLSCFKRKDTIGCRYSFPLPYNDTTDFDVVLENKTDIPDQHTLIEEVDAFTIDPKRGITGPYVNRLSPAALLSIPANNDVKICMSSIGVCLYLMNYVSKAESDTVGKAGIGALSGFCRALTIEMRSKATADTTDTHDSMSPFKTAQRRGIMALMDSTAHSEVHAPLAVFRILFGDTFIFSHSFTPLYINQDIAVLHNQEVTAGLPYDTVTQSHVPNVQALDYQYRGEALEDTTRYEYAMMYTSSKVLLKDQPTSVSSPQYPFNSY